MSALPPDVEAGVAAIRHRQLEAAYDRLGGRAALDPAERRAIEALADAIVAGVLRRPAAAVRTGAVDPAVAARLLPTEEGQGDGPLASSGRPVDPQAPGADP